MYICRTLDAIGYRRLVATAALTDGAPDTLEVLMVTPECYPLVKTGGLADVAGALPLALAGSAVRSSVLMPGYPGVAERLASRSTVATIGDLFGGPAEIVSGTTPDGLEVWLVDAPHLYDRVGGPYLDASGRDWSDNHLRFGALGWVGAEIALGRLGPRRPDLVHLHDWQSALTAAYLRYHSPDDAPPSLLTIHNLAFQGVFDADALADLRLPDDAMEFGALEYWGRLSFLKAGVLWCDRINTVSPTYAREILGHECGMGFDGLLRGRGGDVSGIVNGIDESVWDPATDPNVPSPYSNRRLSAKAANRRALQTELGLATDATGPLFCVISRLTTQKGLDLLLEAVPRLVASGAQLAVLGAGERWIEDGFRSAAAAHPAHVAAVIGYDEPLAHRLQAGADSIIVPSRFEPCGLTQLYGLRYGTLPLVARVGGLADTVIDANEAALRDGVATGFQFAPVTTEALAIAIDRAVELHADTAAWQRVQRRAMTRDVSWTLAARRYRALYDSILEQHRAR